MRARTQPVEAELRELLMWAAEHIARDKVELEISHTNFSTRRIDDADVRAEVAEINHWIRKTRRALRRSARARRSTAVRGVEL